MKKEIIYTEKAPDAIGPYSQAVSYNGLLFTSGQVAINSTTAELVLSSIEEETHQVMRNLIAILEKAGTDVSTVLKTTIFLTDINDFKIVNEVYASYFNTEDYPARETVQVAQLPRGVNVEISMIAHLKK